MHTILETHSRLEGAVWLSLPLAKWTARSCNSNGRDEPKLSNCSLPLLPLIGLSNVWVIKKVQLYLLLTTLWDFRGLLLLGRLAKAQVTSFLLHPAPFAQHYWHRPQSMPNQPTKMRARSLLPGLCAETEMHHYDALHLICTGNSSDDGDITRPLKADAPQSVGYFQSLYTFARKCKRLHHSECYRDTCHKSDPHNSSDWFCRQAFHC